MVEKTTNLEQNAAKKERFEFVLTINGNIVCQRYFSINNFKRDSYSSIELVESLDKCVNLIDRELKSKTHLYEKMTAPMVFKNEEEAKNWLAVHPYSLEVPSYVVMSENENNYVWNGEALEPYQKNFNKSDYIVSSEPEYPCVLKFAFIDNGRTVASKVWDGNVYPRFVRTNIDLSSTKNKYRAEGIYAPVEQALIEIFNKEHKDIIYDIVHELCTCCSKESSSEYTTKVDYGKKTYDLDVRSAYYKTIRNLEKKYSQKTSEYFKNL